MGRTMVFSLAVLLLVGYTVGIFMVDSHITSQRTRYENSIALYTLREENLQQQITQLEAMQQTLTGRRSSLTTEISALKSQVTTQSQQAFEQAQQQALEQQQLEQQKALQEQLAQQQLQQQQLEQQRLIEQQILAARRRTRAS